MSKGKKGGKRGGKRAPRVRRQRANKGQYASVIDEVTLDYQCNNNVAYTLKNFALTNSTRAKIVAAAYQYYRITKVELMWKPQADTFIALNNNIGSQVSVPYLYYLIDKASTLPPAWTLSMIRAAGAKPRRLDDKTLSVSFKPACYITSTDSPPGGALVAENAAMMRTSPWLATNANAGNGTTGTVWQPSSVDHHGLSFFIEQTNQAQGMIPALLTVRLHYEFKKPLWSTVPQGVHEPEPATIIDADLLNGEVI